MEQTLNQYMTLIFFGLAVFVAWRLWTVLGTKTGHERPPVEPVSRPDPKPLNGKANAPDSEREYDPEPEADRWKGIAEPGSTVANGLDAIIRIEPDFDANGFREGAKAAYEMIVNAFAAGDRETLKPFLSKDVFAGFNEAIAQREKNGERMETTFVSIDKAEFNSVEVKGRTAMIAMDFASSLISVTRDANGAVVDGHPGEVAEVTDRWTFSRNLGSNDPNWILAETESD